MYGYMHICRFRNVLLAQRISALNCQNIIDMKNKLDLDILAQRFANVINSQNSQIKSIGKTENIDIENLKINLDKEVENKVEINDVMVIENIVFDYDDNSNHNEIEKEIEKKRRIEIDLNVYVNEINLNFSKTNQTSELIKWKQKNEKVSDNFVDLNPLMGIDSDVDVGSDEKKYVTPYIDGISIVNSMDSIFMVYIISINKSPIDSNSGLELSDVYIDDINSVFMVNILPITDPPIDTDDKEINDQGLNSDHKGIYKFAYVFVDV
jgi:hypothetical protein